GHGDITEVRDAQGNVLNRYTYDIWGNPLVQEERVPNIFRYSGEYWDAATNLQYLRARWYDPSIGRFINEDTYEGGIKNPLSLNLYTYVVNNPLRFMDPSGHAWIDILQGFNEAGSEAVSFGLSALWENGPRVGEEEDYWLGQYLGFSTTSVIAAIGAAVSAGTAAGSSMVCATGAGCVVGGPVAVGAAIVGTYQAGVGTYALSQANKSWDNYQEHSKVSESLRKSIKSKDLPANGPLRFIPDKKKGVITKKGSDGKNYYVDRFGNEWREGPYHGDPSLKFTKEWDVVLSKQGVKVWGKLANIKNGVSYVNIRPDGYLSH
ncbi:polymorphic toxin type 17 domain-containing protein, partial [Paenibacillus alvei]|uniref:polymorphic toxin type 17 domain-containing protein n=1 Tax=Paenibacillus alvei TaxID=44250 RepID=UPI00228213A5